MDMLHMIMMATVMVVGVALLATGAWFHLNHERLKADPVLITSCYLWGSGMIVANFAIPHLV